MPSRRALERPLAALLLVALAFGALLRAEVLWQQVAENPRLPQWDMARHGLDGVRLAEALRQGDAVGFAVRLHERSVWPPLMPLVTAPFLVLFGVDWSVPRHLSAVFFILTALALVLAGRALDRRAGMAAGLVAATLWCASPFVLLMSSLVMLEVPGALLTVLAFATYARALEAEEDPRRFRLAALAATALFFCKYNYGLLWLVPLAVNEAWRHWGSPRAALHALGAGAARVEWRRPAVMLALLWIGLAAAVIESGGFDGSFLGLRFRLTSWGGPIHVLLAVALLSELRASRRNRWKKRLAALPSAARIFVAWTVFPIALWILLPPHLGELLAFVGNRSLGPPPLSAEYFAYYPRVFSGWYSPPRPLGTVALLLSLVFVARLLARRLDPRQRMLALTILVGALAILLHPYKLPRFLFTLAPLIWLAAGLTFAKGFDLLGDRDARFASLIAGGAVVLTLLAVEIDRGELRRHFELRTVPRSSEPVLRLIGRVARHQPDTAVLGTWNDLSPALVEWYLRRDPDFPRRRLPFVPKLARTDPESICDVLEARRVVSLEPLESRPAPEPGRADFAAETAWLEPYRAALATAPCFLRAREWVLEGAGHRLRVYRRRGE